VALGFTSHGGDYSRQQRAIEAFGEPQEQEIFEEVMALGKRSFLAIQ